MRIATALLQHYRENGEYKERLYDFVPRVGLEEIRKAVLDPERCAALLERFRIAKAAVSDPWLEREEPYHPGQFRDLDPPQGAGCGAAEEDAGGGRAVDPWERASALVGPPPEGAVR